MALMLQPFPADLRILNTVSTVLGAQDSLEAINTNTLMDRALVSCAANNMIYMLRKDSVTPPSGTSIVAPAAGPGRWFEYATGGAASLPLPSVLYVDPTLIPATTRNGSIEAPFATLGAALTALPAFGGTVIVCSSLVGLVTTYTPPSTQSIKIIGQGTRYGGSTVYGTEDIGDVTFELDEDGSMFLTLEDVSAIARLKFTSAGGNASATVLATRSAVPIDCDDAGMSAGTTGIFTDCLQPSLNHKWGFSSPVTFNNCWGFGLDHAGDGPVHLNGSPTGTISETVAIVYAALVGGACKVYLDPAALASFTRAKILVTNGALYGTGNINVFGTWDFTGVTPNIVAGATINLTLNAAHTPAVPAQPDGFCNATFAGAPATKVGVVGCTINGSGVVVLTIRNFDTIDHTLTSPVFTVLWEVRHDP